MMLSLVTIPEKGPTELSLKLPQPRSGACVSVLNCKMYIWGGHTQFLLEAGDDCCPIEDNLPNSDESYIDVYNLSSRNWEQYPTSGDIPHVGDGPTMVGFEESLYVFGGFNDGVYTGDLYEFNTITNTWSCVATSDGAVKPSPRYGLGSVLYNEKICIFGGIGPLIDSLQLGAKYVSAQKFKRELTYGFNNEMFLFDIKKGCWTDVELNNPQNRPPPCAFFTFNMVSPHQAVLFGGYHQGGDMSDVYLFNFEVMAWSGAIKQPIPSEPWPARRSYHTACSIFDPSEENLNVDPHLLILWGKGADSRHCDDIWILNTVTMKWIEVHLSLKSKMGHMMAGYYFDGIAELVTLGGNIRRSSKSDRHVSTDLTIFSFGVLSLTEWCILAVNIHQLQQSQFFSRLPPHIKDIVTKNQYIKI